ncbi:hypothetical protein [Massilia soli]|uniref:Uncharacterized protein n=1 Tax=Massilia soli TaxID=2792854 RepID=A0ABS7SQ78_9BURK|nr:hypothetical protein [Massilia soli]MBZ2207375.1 hypothetical protein [Massilia soli]
MEKVNRVRTARGYRGMPNKAADTSGRSAGAAQERMIDLEQRRGAVPDPRLATPAPAPASKCLICKFRRPVILAKEGGDA